MIELAVELVCIWLLAGLACFFLGVAYEYARREKQEYRAPWQASQPDPFDAGIAALAVMKHAHYQSMQDNSRGWGNG